MIIKVCESSTGCRVVFDEMPVVQTGGEVLPLQTANAYYKGEPAGPSLVRTPRFGGSILLAQATPNKNIQFVPGSREDYEHGRWSAKLVADQEIQGVRCAKGTRVFFDEHGKLKSAHISADQDFQGVRCAGGTTVTTVGFYESGKLKYAILAADQEIQGVKFHKGDKVEFDESGKPR